MTIKFSNSFEVQPNTRGGGGGGGGGGTSDYNDLTNKPSINGVTLQGALTSSDLNLSSDYDDLTDKPSINGVTLQGALTSSDLNITAGIAVEYEGIEE